MASETNPQENRQNNTPPLVPQELEAENLALKAQVAALQSRLATLETGQTGCTTQYFSSTNLVALLRASPRLFLALLGVILAGLPPALVFLERWRNTPGVRDALRAVWCRVDLLCQTPLPSYFLLIYSSFTLLILLFLYVNRTCSETFLRQPAAAPGDLPAPVISTRQRRVSRILLLSSLVLLMLLLALKNYALLAPGLLLILLVYLSGCLLAEFKIEDLLNRPRHLPPWLLAFGFALISLSLFLQQLYSAGALAWIYTLLLAAAITALLLWRRQLNPALWIMLLALLFYTYKLNSWQFAIIGDEYNFFTFAGEILTRHGLKNVLANLFNGQGVYGSHPYFSSLIQAASMALFGINNFGWRFSSLFLTAAALIPFYLFLRRFIQVRPALLCILFLAASHYLMAFGKIGYNNLQAFFALAVTLWAAGEALHTRRPTAYAVMGLATGMCFYVYPAALYITPLPFFLLVLYDPPVSRPALRRWGAALAVFSLLFLPLLIQPGYWEEKIPGTLLNKPEILRETGLLKHLGLNFLYAAFSYLYAPEETHFVVSSYIDPLSAVFVPLGIAWGAQHLRRGRFAAFVLGSFLLMLFLVGATHDRQWPSATRMFLLLPWFALFAALGLEWLLQRLEAWRLTGKKLRLILLVVITAVIAANLTQAYSLVRQRTTGVPDLEVLFLRLLQRNEKLGYNSTLSYFFITQPDWGIDGIRELQNVYGLPASQAQLLRAVVQTPELPAWAVARIQAEDTLVIIQPWMAEPLKTEIVKSLAGYGKQPCAIRDAPHTDPRFTLWLSAPQVNLCPAEGVWQPDGY